MKKRSILSGLMGVAEYPIFAPQKAPKIGMRKGLKKLRFPLPARRQNPLAPLPVRSDFDAHLMGGHSSQTKREKLPIFCPLKALILLAFTPGRSCAAPQAEK